MDDIAIRVENLSKQYKIGLSQKRHDTLRDQISDLASRSAQAILRSNHKSEIANPKSDDTIWALEDLSFEVKRGEAVGIIGRNGAGKSTLLKILSRITKPTRGWAEIYGRVGSLLEVGTGFHGELTGRENIYLNGAILGMRKREIARKFDEIVAFAEVERFIDTPVKHYSSGMYVRLAFAVAAHLEPEILIVDEVLAVGDAAFQKKCLGKMGDVAKQGRTVLFVSHNIGSIRSLCEKGIWLDTGKIHLNGDILPVTSSYIDSLTNLGSNGNDLSAIKRNWNLGERVRLSGVEFNAGFPVCHGEPLQIRFEFETFKPICDVAIGIGFNSLEGVRILSLDSDLDNIGQDLPGGISGTLEMDLAELYLQPGRYLVDIGIRSRTGKLLDGLVGCAQIEIVPGPNTPGQIIRPDGGVRLPAKWTWQKFS